MAITYLISIVDYMNTPNEHHGYFHVSITADGPLACLRRNTERAFVVAQLQNLLSPRLILNEFPAHRQLASCVDLLAFSIRKEKIELILFAIDVSLCQYINKIICSTLEEHVNEAASPYTRRTFQSRTRQLRGPHHALAKTCALHLNHGDWEHDRYSSIGFYLHDRRGDWMRLWRMSALYEQDPENYRGLIMNHLTRGATFSQYAAM